MDTPYSTKVRAKAARATPHGIVHLRLTVGMRGAYAWPPLESRISDALEPFAPISSPSARLNETMSHPDP
ncbi:hypothetical protein TPB0596_45330 [Tsukamurella pulmonis]|nr:hypothetical protein TPB0596_45330 [Tsukamurella pulmonis]